MGPNRDLDSYEKKTEISIKWSKIEKSKNGRFFLRYSKTFAKKYFFIIPTTEYRSFCSKRQITFKLALNR